MENNKLAIKTVFNPDRDTAKAKRAADKLIDIVKKNEWSIKVGNGEHLMYEAWQTVGKYFNVTVATKDAEPIEIGGISGFKAIGYVIDNRTGMEVGHAEAYCMRDEENWSTRPKFEWQNNKKVKVGDVPVPTFQLASMAQTRAGSKALRQMFGFVVALAGYSPTPAEEMTGEESNEHEQLISEKQVDFINKLLIEKGYPEKSIKVKYGVDVNQLTRKQASAIIESLMALPSALSKAVDASFAGKTNEDEDEINLDEIPDLG